MIAVGIFLGVLLGGYILFQLNALEVSRYSFGSDKLNKGFSGKRIVHLGDLHGKSFGKSNEKLKKLIDKEKPDAVFLTGDMIDADKLDYSPVISLLEHLTGNYKVFYIIGNHEQKALIKKHHKAYRKYFKKINTLDMTRMNNQAVVIDSNFDVIEKRTCHKNMALEHNDCINLYSLILPFSSYRYLLSNRDELSIDLDYMQRKLGKPNTENFNLLLAHNPLYFEEYAKLGVDMVLSGHVHGGIVRLPFVGGVFSPDRTFFPKYDFGEFEMDKTRMFVTKGLGGSALLFRVNCRPEIGVIDFK